MEEIMTICEELKELLRTHAEEQRLQERLKDLAAQRSAWEKRSALFVPEKRRLERGASALELGADYEAIRNLRAQIEQHKQEQAALNEDLTEARTDLHNADEALTLIEVEYRDRLTEQTKLASVCQRVKSLDEQILKRQEAAAVARREYEESEQRYKECVTHVESDQKSLERTEISLREAKKFLQLHASDEKLQATLPGIQKCFAMYEAAEQKRVALQDARQQAIQARQEAQNVLNDRSALFSDMTHRYGAIERNYTRARAFYESTLHGKSISEWREICEKNTAMLASLDELYKKYQSLRELEDKLQLRHEERLKLQEESRNLNMRDVEQASKMNELQEEVSRLERRVELLRSLEALDLTAVRELLQESTPCPLCGSTSHPYLSGLIVPDHEETHGQLRKSQQELEALREELASRQAKSGKLAVAMSELSMEESELKRKINALNAEIASSVSLLGLNFASGISPFDEIDRLKQKTRDSLQLAQNAADTAEAAQREMMSAQDELTQIRATREEAARYNQEAMFAHQNAQTQTEQLEAEAKTQIEAVNSLKRELTSQIMPYGYKTLPDKNPKQVVEALERRLQDWQEGTARASSLEREVTVAGTKLATLKKEREGLKVMREEALTRLKALEADRDVVQQQRIVLFGSRMPDSEQARMSGEVDILRAKMEERRERKKSAMHRQNELLSKIHMLETSIATERDLLQKNGIAFNKRLMSLGFKSEEDYTSSLLTPEERRDLQGKLRELTQTDLELSAERENTQARLLDLQAAGTSSDLPSKLAEFKAAIADNPDIVASQLPEIRELLLSCGLSEDML